MNLAIEAGFIPFSSSENIGLFLNVEPQVKVSNNTLVGLRIAVTINSQTYESKDESQFIIDNIEYENGFLSIVPTFSYSLNEALLWDKYIFRPYIGLGVGPYLLANYVDIFQIGTVNSSYVEVPVHYQIGLLFRSGFELGKSRLGLEYNFISKADIEIPSGQKIGTVNSSYLGLSIGFTI
ncbi:hypothetical protein [Ekhidna sp.]